MSWPACLRLGITKEFLCICLCIVLLDWHLWSDNAGAYMHGWRLLKRIFFIFMAILSFCLLIRLQFASAGGLQSVTALWVHKRLRGCICVGGIHGHRDSLNYWPIMQIQIKIQIHIHICIYTNQERCTNMYYKIIRTRKIYLHLSRPKLRSTM